MNALYNHDFLTVRYYGPRATPPEDVGLWTVVFKRWWQHHQDYVVQGGEAGWGYRERPNVGFLAGAVWTAGGVAIQEYDERKKNAEDKRFAYDGRGDLWVGLGGKGFKLEAKHQHVYLHTRGTEGTLCAAADSAGLDSDRVKRDTDFTGGVAFLSLWLPEDRREEWRDQRVAHLRDEDRTIETMLKKSYNYSFRVDAFDGDAPVDASGDVPVGITMMIGLDRR